MAEYDAGNLDIEPDQPWRVDLFRPEDAEGVVRLFHSVYGAGYPVRTYLEPQRLIAENAARRTISSVARTPRGDVVGHNALFASAPHPGCYESGAGAVHTAYRGGKGIFTEMVAHGLKMAEVFPEVDAVFGEPVCNHTFSQRLVIKQGFVPRALEVDLMPAEAYEKEHAAKGRVSAYLAFKTFRPRPHRVYLPAVYGEILRFFCEALDDKRDIRSTEGAAPGNDVSDIRTQVFDFASVARVAVHKPGKDFASRLESLDAELRQKGILVAQVWMNLAFPWVGGAVEALRRRGYFLGGYLPRWFDTDGLLMQKMTGTPNWGGISTYGDRAEEILKRVRSDWEAGSETAKERG